MNQASPGVSKRTPSVSTSTTRPQTAFDSDKLAVESMQSWAVDHSDEATDPNPNVELLPPLRSHRCLMVQGQRKWWHYELSSPELGTGTTSKPQLFAMPGRNGWQLVSVQDQTWMAFELDAARTIQAIVQEWGTPPIKVLNDWVAQWSNLIETASRQDRDAVGLAHVVAQPNGELVPLGLYALLQSRLMNSIETHSHVQSLDAGKKTKDSGNEASKGHSEPAFEAWLAEQAKAPLSIFDDLQSSVARRVAGSSKPNVDLSATAKPAPKFELKQNAKSAKSSLPKSATSNKQSSRAKSKQGPILIAATVVCALMLAFVAWKLLAPDNSKTTATTVASSANDSTAKPSQMPESEADPAKADLSSGNPEEDANEDLDVSGTDPDQSVLPALETAIAPADPKLTGRLNSFFSTIADGQPPTLDFSKESEIVSTDDIVRASLENQPDSINATNDMNAAGDSAATEVSQANESNKSEVVDQANEASNDEANNFVRDKLTLAEAMTKHILRLPSRPREKAAIAVLEIKTESAKLIAPANRLEIVGKNRSEWTINDSELPGELMIGVQSTPGKNWELKFFVNCRSENLPTAFPVDPKSSTILLQRLLAYQGWLNSQLSQARTARDATSDSNLRRLMLDGIKRIESELKKAEQVCEDWQKIDTFVAQFFADHQITITTAGSAAALQNSDSVE